MKSVSFETRDEWETFREGKISGAKADDIFSVKEVTVNDIKSVLDRKEIEYKKSANKAELMSLIPEDCSDEVKAKLVKKLGFYEILAYKVAVPEEGNEDPMERGTRLEEEAVQAVAKKLGKDISNDLVVWVSDVNDALMYSPDGVISDEAVVETKCLSSAWHLYIFYEQEIPPQYRRQNVQAFIVNEKLQTLYFACYDPRIPSLPLHIITIKREDIEAEIEEYKQYEIEMMEEINRLAAELSF